MRISDWSSDVCSSDLLENMLRFEDGGFTVSTADAQAIADWQKNPVTGAEIQYRPARVLLQDFTGVPCVVDQIGRASCRERVCQYVYISVVAVSFKKKKITDMNHT